MLILHAGLLKDEFFLWGEKPVESAAGESPRKRGRKPKAAENTYPHRAGMDDLAAELAAADVTISGKDAPAVSLYAWLPTADGKPIPSSPLISEQPENISGVQIAPWKITALRLTPERAVDFLCRCAGKSVLAPGMIIGDDVTYWATAMRFAGELAARQQFLPGMKRIEDKYFARWEPVITGADAGRMAKISTAMPSAARALSNDGANLLAIPSSEIVSSFIRMVVDHLVRTSEEGIDVPRPAARKRRKETFGSIHDQWLHALRSADGAMEGDAAELERFAAQLAEWRRPVSVADRAPFRLCFRLDEPAPGQHDADFGAVEFSGGHGNGEWRVQYLLQAVDDPSLFIPAADAWVEKSKSSKILKSRGFRAREYLLSTLGQAAAICPRIEASLRTPNPGGYELDSSGAHDFLTRRAAALEQAGFGLILPAWWTRRGTKLRLAAKAAVKSPKMQGGAGLTLDSVLKFDWKLALGSEEITLSELEALARLKEPLVMFRGQWTQVNADEIVAALEYWKKKDGGGEASLRDIVRMALGAEKAPGGIALDGVEAGGWIADFLAQLDGRAKFAEINAPENFNGELRPYQTRGYSWLAFLRRWGLGACLADDMGLGKTIQALALIQRDRAAKEKRPVLIVCPTSVVGNWRKEAERFTPDLSVMVHHGIARAKGKSFIKDAKKHAIVISSYALIHRDLEAFKGVKWAGVILDEAQNVKNPETKQSKAAWSLAADYRFALTGTPVENSVGELWSIMEFLNPGFLGSQTEFKRLFFIPIMAHRDEAAAQRLKRLTGPFILRRMKTDRTIIADLPEKMEMKVFCTLTKEQASLYEAVVKEMTGELAEARGIQRKGMILAALSKLKQVCNHPAQFLGDNSAIPGRSGKLARLTEMLEEILSVGDRALVFSQFSEMGEILRRHIQETFGQEVLFLHGGVPKKKRDAMIERFQSDGDGAPGIFILSLKAGGTGLNLTRANHVFHFDRWWNPAVENQATDRAFRIGQTKNVQVHKFLCAGTLEEKIDEMIERKKEIADSIVGAGEAWLTELSTSELKELFKLRKEAVAE